jgi:MAF protein
MNRIILASKSPRRKELLEQIGVDFIIDSIDVEEVFDQALPFQEQIMEVALSKATPIAKSNYDDIVIGADTMISINNIKLGKPKDKDEARRILTMLSNKTHKVYTGVAICYQGQNLMFYEETNVTFWDLTNEEIEVYLKTNEWQDKAGAYGIQGIGTKLVKSITGDYNNVVGLPVSKLIRIIEKLI